MTAASTLPAASVADPAVECTADLDHPCGSGEGETPCPSCREIEARYRREWENTFADERRPSEYAQDMVEAGRGHLLSDEQRATVRR